MLIELCKQLSDSKDLLIVRNLTMILFSFAGFIRFDELSSLVFNEDHLVIFIRKSKTDQYRQENENLISKGNTADCPVNMYQRYLDLLEDMEEKYQYFFHIQTNF